MAELSEIVPPDIVNAPPQPTPTPPPTLAVLPEISPPDIVNVPYTSTPPPRSVAPPVMVPADSVPLVSVRLPPSKIWMTPKYPAASIT